MEAPRCFEGVHFALDLGASLSLKEKTQFRELLESHGAIIDQVFANVTDALVVTEERLRGHFQKVEKARKSFKPVVSTKYLILNAEQGRCVDADVLTLDGFLELPNPKDNFSEYVTKSEAKVVPAINEAVSLIQALLAAPDQVPSGLVDKLKRPVWMPHLSALFSRCVPDPRFVDYGSENENEDEDGGEPTLGSRRILTESGNVIEQIRIEREKKNLALMATRAEAKAEEEKRHFEKKGARRALEVMAREEETVFEAQVDEQIEAIEEAIATSYIYNNFHSNLRKRKTKTKERKPIAEGALDHLFEDVSDSGSSSESDPGSARPKLMKANPFYNLTLSAKTEILNPSEDDEESEAEKPRRRPPPRARPPEVQRRVRAVSDEEGSGSENGSEAPPPKANYLADFEKRISELISATPEEFTAQLEESKAQREVQLKEEAQKKRTEALRSGVPVKPTTWAKPPKPQSDAGLKVFIGGIKYEDITKAAAANKWPADKLKLVKEARIKEIKRLCGSFGSIKTWEEKWDEGFAFVTFEKKDSADQMQRTLSQFDYRKGLCKQIRTRILAEKGEKLAVPSHSFYVRWPKFYQRIVENNKKKRADEKAKEKEEKEKKEKEGAEAEASALTEAQA